MKCLRCSQYIPTGTNEKYTFHILRDYEHNATNHIYEVKLGEEFALCNTCFEKFKKGE